VCGWGLTIIRLVTSFCENESFIASDHGVEACRLNRTTGKFKASNRLRVGKSRSKSDISHYGIYREGFSEATKLEIEWFDKHLKTNPTSSK